MANDRKSFKGQAGHVTAEWVVVTLILILVLFAPVTDDNQSVTGMLMESIRDFDRNKSLLYSLP
jgi:hypothetical protein